MERTRILVWDLPTRLFHWLLAISFAGAFLTAESERVRDIHVAFGYSLLGLLAFRLVWGLIGSRYARFASFTYGPKAVLAYLGSLVTRRPVHYVGHNPAGSWVIYAILGLGIAAGASGYALYEDIGGRWMESLHEGTANAMLALVIVHIAGVVVSSFLHRENLVAAMLTGHKYGSPSQAIGRMRWSTALALVGAVVALWTVAVGVADVSPDSVGATTQNAKRDPPHSRHDRDHDT